MKKEQIAFYLGLILIIVGFYTLISPSSEDDFMLKIGPLSGILVGYGLRDMMKSKKES